MARLPRLVIAGQLHLVVQMAHGADPVFRDDADHEGYLQTLMASAREQRVAVHAYALLASGVLLLLTPSSAESLGRMMQAVGRRFGSAFNRRHGRRGSLWEGRFRASVVDAKQHLLDCMRFVESAPVREGLASEASEFRWSSAGHHVGRRVDAGITEHPLYWSIGNTPFEREANYRRLLDVPLPGGLQAALQASAHKSWAFGSSDFVESIASQTGRRLVPAARGRPRKLI